MQTDEFEWGRLAHSSKILKYGLNHRHNLLLSTDCVASIDYMDEVLVEMPAFALHMSAVIY